MKCVATNRVFDETRSLFAAAGVTLVAPDTDEPLSAGTLRGHAADADALMAFMTDRIDGPFLATCPQLKVVGAALKGHDNVDLEAAADAGVWVTIVPDLLTIPTAELSVGLMLALGRHIVTADAALRAAPFAGWRPCFYGSGLDGSVVGLMGYGAVGRAIAGRLQGFGCTVIANDAHNTGDEAARAASFDEVLTTADWLVLALPLTADTADLLDCDALARIKPGAFLINPARGSLVDEAAVADALEDGRLGGYAADVFACEDLSRPGRPTGIEPRLLAPGARTVLTPHIGSAVTAARQAIERSAAHSILAALQGEVPPFAANAPKRVRAC